MSRDLAQVAVAPLCETRQVDPADLLSRYGDRVLHVERVPARDAVVEPWPDWVSPRVRAVFEAEGAVELWAHQAEGLRLVRDGRHVVISTGTAEPASKARTALGPSVVLTVAGSGKRESSNWPW